MKSAFQKFLEDWRQEKKKLLFELMGSLLFIISLSMVSYYGDDVDTRYVLIFNGLGSICLLIFSWMIHSFPLIMLNVVCLLIAVVGLI